jgi:hypothetical protein
MTGTEERALGQVKGFGRRKARGLFHLYETTRLIVMDLMCRSPVKR